MNVQKRKEIERREIGQTILRDSNKNTRSTNKRSASDNFGLTNSIKYFKCGKTHDIKTFSGILVHALIMVRRDTN